MRTTVVAGVYPNGLPHPPLSMRVRFAAELVIVATLATLLLVFLPHHMRTTAVYLPLALIGLGLIGFTARETKERIWGPPDSPDFDRVRRCAISMTVLTLPPVFVFFVVGLVMGRILNVNFLITLCLYLPWALVQQTIFQFYLLGRLRAVLPFASPLFLAILNGVLYGLVHLPNVWVTLVTIIGGIFWSYSYYRDRYVLPIAISHAVLGATFYYWVLGHDLWQNMWQRFAM
jgi:membrane protease YdiL (CAAX protease family)